MNGQWTGRYSGGNGISGQLVVDLDDHGSHYEGSAYVCDDNTALPRTCVFIKTPDKSNSCKLTAQIYPIDPQTGTATTWEKLSALFPGVVHGQKADAKIEYNGSTLKVNWTTDIGISGEATLPRSRSSEATEYQPLHEVSSWEQFKKFVAGLDHRRHIFRGQEKTQRLRTGFHRTGRADLNFFLNADISTLHRHLSHRTRHIFNLEIPDQNGAFLNLLQHHGYPTPLLDWTYSPFVSAFFAYRNIKNSQAESSTDNEKVRIFVFDQKEWRASYPQMTRLTGLPHFSIMEFIAIENERMVPQQSISSVTNVDDIESYIRSLETVEKKFLRIIDLPLKERPLVMRELSTMGISAGSLFPGLDGSCEELRERFFRL